MRGTSSDRRAATVLTVAVAVLAAVATALVPPARAGEVPVLAPSLTPTAGAAPLAVTLHVGAAGEGEAALAGGLVAWGDGAPDSPLVPDGDGGSLRATHTYVFGGWYPVLVRVHDRSGAWSPWPGTRTI